MATKKTGTLQMRTKRSGILPGFIALIMGGVALDYDAGHWHILHHLLGRYSFVVALALIIGFTAWVVRLCTRPAGYAKITSKETSE